MIINITKMNGLGNDYVFINTLDDISLFHIVSPYISKLSDRNFGIGGDGVIFIMPSNKADCRMRMFNKDGSEGTMCGNGIRQLAKFVWDKNIINKTPLLVETGNGVLFIDLECNEDNKMKNATVNMGAISFDPTIIPFCSPDNRMEQGIPIFNYSYKEKELQFYVGSIGSKHAVCFLEEDVTTVDFCTIGKQIEKNISLFSDGVNVEFVNIISSTKCIMRVWERGSGHTLACGTGATFVVGLGMHLGVFDKNQDIEVELERGSLFISQKDSTMFMKGVADLVFEGIIDLSTL